MGENDYKKLYWHMQHKYKKLEEEKDKLDDSSYEDLLLENARLVKANESLEKENKTLMDNLDNYKGRGKKYMGKILRLSTHLDFGFIHEDKFGTIFFHVKNTDKISLKENYINKNVEFNLNKSDKGYNAINVEIME